ncbi:MAG: hypothetical protein K2G39_06065 [Lachnospiraceae bacterium]|nr:hypothetical protein [Lachnospiraceae bacterium]
MMSEDTKAAQTSGKFTVISAIIGGGCVIIAAIFGMFSININMKNDYKELQFNNSELVEKINALQIEFDKLKVQLEAGEQEINNLKNEMEALKESKISIFDLDAMNTNEQYWFDYSDGHSSECFIDTNNVDYLTAHMGFHYRTNKEEILNPTYQLNDNYSICEGKIIWSAANEDSKEKAWIEFYSEDTLIYTTAPIDINNKSTDFSFSIKGVKELKIVKNGTEPLYGEMVIIYT